MHGTISWFKDRAQPSRRAIYRLDGKLSERSELPQQKSKTVHASA
jgi:hypothetical protein